MVSMAFQTTASSRQQDHIVIVRQRVPYLLVGQGVDVFMRLFRETRGQ
jgi:hypothetical protein